MNTQRQILAVRTTFMIYCINKCNTKWDDVSITNEMKSHFAGRLSLWQKSTFAS